MLPWRQIRSLLFCAPADAFTRPLATSCQLLLGPLDCARFVAPADIKFSQSAKNLCLRISSKQSCLATHINQFSQSAKHFCLRSRQSRVANKQLLVPASAEEFQPRCMWPGPPSRYHPPPLPRVMFSVFSRFTFQNGLRLKYK